MDEQVDRLVKKAWTMYQDTPLSQRLMIAVSGIPGSGMYLENICKLLVHGTDELQAKQHLHLL